MSTLKIIKRLLALLLAVLLCFSSLGDPGVLTAFAEGVGQEEIAEVGELPTEAPEATAPAEETEAPAETAPAEETEAPEETAPAEETEAPAETAPAEETEAPEATAPAEETEAPAETAPAEETGEAEKAKTQMQDVDAAEESAQESAWETVNGRYVSVQFLPVESSTVRKQPGVQSIDQSSCAAPEGTTILEGYSFSGTEGCEYALVTLTASPSLGEGESLSVYPVSGGKPAAEPMTQHMAVGESLYLPLDGCDGFLLVKAAAKAPETKLEDQTLKAAAGAAGNLTLAGFLPKGSALAIREPGAEADPRDPSHLVSIEERLEGRGDLLLACQIHVLDGEGMEFRPETGRPFVVTIRSESIREALERGFALKVYHIPETPADAIALPAAEEAPVYFASGDTLVFEAEGLYDYAVMSTARCKTVTTSDGMNYRIQVTYDSASGIPMEGTDLLVREIVPGTEEYARYIDESIRAMGADAEQIGLTRVFDIKIVDVRDPSLVYEPDGSVEVSITLVGAALDEYAIVDVLHFADSGEVSGCPVGVNNSVNGETVRFSTDSFSVFVVVAAKLTETVEASDGHTYEISVTYGRTAGIPMEGTALQVREILPGEDGYDEYLAASAQKVGVKPESIALSRLFDIKIVDANDHGTVYEPVGDVDVSIRLVGETLEDYLSIDVLHFTECGNADGFTVYDMDSGIDGETVRFKTGSFSVYAVTGTVHVREFHFYTLNEYLEYEPYYLNNGTENPAVVQYVRSGETPVAPQNPVNPQDQEATFAGWYQGNASYSTTAPQDLDTNSYPRYDFSQPLELDEDDVVHLYAKFTHYYYVIFHDQYDLETDTFPVAFTRRMDQNGQDDSDWYIRVDQYSVAYQDPDNLDDTKMVFVGWSSTPVKEPGAAFDDFGDPVSTVPTDANGRYEVTETVHLYPIFRAVKWLSYFSGPSGSHATFFTDTYHFDGVGPESLPGSAVMTRDPMPSGQEYEFEGWYVGATVDDDSGEADVSGAVKIANADGSLCAGVSVPAYGVEVFAPSGGNAYLKLSNPSATLYANWTLRTTASYSVVILGQEAKVNPGPTDYEFAEKFIYTGTIGEAVDADNVHGFIHDWASLTALHTYTGFNAMHPDLETPLTAETNDTNNPYHVFRFDHTDYDDADPKTIAANGGTTIYVYYNWDWDPSATPPDMTGVAPTLKFVDSLDPTKTFSFLFNGAAVTEASVDYGDSLSLYLPANPVSQISEDGLSFNGWYADQKCTSRVFFEDDEAYQSYAGIKVLFDTMPSVDLTLYAGWTREWFLIKIDPNYGELYKKVNGVLTGTGSTWFWKEYGDTFQEYVTVKRDYVESDSGSWYYVKKDRAYYGYPDAWVNGEDANRQTYYTQVPGEATEMGTFQYDPNVYRYAGWYEVLFDADGNEIGEADERYDFESTVDHNVTLRLRWMKTGVFYLEYDPGEGTLNKDDGNEVLYLELDGDTYADDADVVVSRVAEAPEGYEFVGWRIRQDDSGTIYRPGQTFHLRSIYMATVQGRRTVFLDAVYEQVPSAAVVYHVNGGTFDLSAVTSGSADAVYGHPVDSNYRDYQTGYDETAQTVSISRLVNNSEFVLSTGSWLSRDGATFAGWCENPEQFYDESKKDEYPLLTGGGTYRVGANPGEDPTVHLYAIWAVDVKFHLNTENANFGGDWGSGYSLDGDCYTQSGATIGSVLDWPPHDPVYTGAEGRSFLYWATVDNSSNLIQYDFTQPIEGALDLYACWGSANTYSVKVVDSSDYPTIALASWVDGDLDGTAGDAVISLTAERQAPAVLASAISTAAPSPYAFSFATVASKTMSIQYIQEERIDQIYYSPKDGEIHLVYGSGADARDVVLDRENQQLYFVYYQVRTPSIGYLLMEISGDVTPITNMSADAPTSTAQLGVPISADAVFTISSTYQPMAWLPGTLDPSGVAKTDVKYYNFAIGSTGATNSVHLSHKTQAYDGTETGADARPDMLIKNTWRGLLFSQDGGATWFDTGIADPCLYVVFYTETPTIITLYNRTVGLSADMNKRFSYDYWIEEVTLDGDGNITSSSLVFTTRDPSTPYTQSLSDSETYSAFTTTTAAHSYRVTFVLTPQQGFEVTRPTLSPVDGCNAPDVRLPALETYASDTTLPDWVRTAGDSQDATYHYSKADVPYTFIYTVKENDGYCGHSALTVFTNVRSAVNVDLHVAKADISGVIYHAPEWRVAQSPQASSNVWDEHNAYTVHLERGTTVDLTVAKDWTTITHDVPEDYMPGALIYGHDSHTSHLHDATSENDRITLDENASLACYRLAYELVDPANPNVYNLYIKDGGNYRYPLTRMAEQIAQGINGVTRPDDGITFYRLFYLFYPAITVYYVLENSDGTLTPVRGSTDGTSASSTITYNGEQAVLNGTDVKQMQKVGIWERNLLISQEVGRDENGNAIFNIPPLLDMWDDTSGSLNKLDLIYYKLGARPQADSGTVADNISEFPGNRNNQYINPATDEMYDSGVTETLNLDIGIVDHRLQWQFEDEPHFLQLTGWPVIYAIYRERGYNLTITKTVTEETGYNEPFTVTVESMSINRDHYPVEGTGYSVIESTPASGSTPGVITFEMKDGDSITIDGLGHGDYTVTETGNDNFVLSATVKDTQDTGASPANIAVTDNSVIVLGGENKLDADMTLNLINDPQVICRIGSRKFYSVSSAVKFIEEYDADFTETIEMLVPSYLMPASDTPVIPSYLHVTLTTAAPDGDPDNQITGGNAVIVRKSNLTGPMFSNLGELTFENVTLDGNTGVFPAPMVSNEGTLHVASGAVLCNAVSSGNGAAINSLAGAVNMTGGSVSGCSAALGGGIYASGGTVTVSGGSLTDNSADSGGAIYYAGSDSVNLSGGAVGGEGHPNTAVDGAGIYVASGTANISGGSIRYNAATGSGGGLYAYNAYVNVTGGSVDHNTAEINGGGVHMQTLTLTVSGGSFTYNTAADGGAVWAGTGSVVLSGGSMSHNTASGTADPDTGTVTGGCGGAVYTRQSQFRMSGGTVTNNTANQHGGGVYTETGTVTYTGETNSGIKNNTAVNGNGGGVCSDAGTVSISGGSAVLNGNTAANGNGGALWIGSGTATLQNCIIGMRSDPINYSSTNHAVNGAGVFVDTGTVNFIDAVYVRANVASSGGGVGVGSENARLNFSGSVRINENVMPRETLDENNQPVVENVKSNLYLNFDTDTIINFQRVGNNADIGVYVADAQIPTRGVPSARFGSYVNTISDSNLGRIKNDRTENMVVKMDASAKRVYWVRNFAIKVYYVASYENGLPFQNGYDPTNGFTHPSATWARDSVGTPPSYQSIISDVAEDIRSLGRVTPGGTNDSTAIFGNAFVKQNTVADMHFEDYLTEINWNTVANLWEFYKRDGSIIPGGDAVSNQTTLIFIFTEAYYLSLENNSDDTLVLSALNVTKSGGSWNGQVQSIINSAAQAGYGYVFSRNDEIQDALLPVTAEDLVLPPNSSVRILIPGGKGLTYSLEGKFYDTYDPQHPDQNVASGSVDYTQTGNTNPGLSVSEDGFTVGGTTPSEAGQTHELIFGGDREICRIVVSERIQAPGSDPAGPAYVSTGFVGEHAGENETAGRYEYTFVTPNQAALFIRNNKEAFRDSTSSHIVATIEMLQDYMITSDQTVILPDSGIDNNIYEIGFRTSVTGYYQYDKGNTDLTRRAMISRASGNNDSFIRSRKNNKNELISGVTGDRLWLSRLIFDGKNFSGDIDGGVVSTKQWNVEIDHCDISNCIANNGGGLYIDFERTVDSGDGSDYLTVSETSFTNCESKSTKNRMGGGAIWSYARTMTLTKCSFTDCKGQDQGGAVFHRIDFKNSNDYPKCAYKEASTSIFIGCTFTNCQARSGGAVESDAHHVTFTGSQFTNCYSIYHTGLKKYGSGGAIATYIYEGSGSWGKEYDTDLTVSGCSFTHCTAAEGTGTAGNGGAIRSHSMRTTITDSTFSDCRCNNNGGAIAINNNGSNDVDWYTGVVSGCTITDCSSANGYGGAVFSNNMKLTIGVSATSENGTTITNCTASKDGGAVFHDRSAAGTFTTMTGAKISNCVASASESGDNHGGGGLCTKARTVTLTDSTIQSCSTPKQGGGILVNQGSATITLTDTTVSSCTAGGSGGGLYTNQSNYDLMIQKGTGSGCSFSGNESTEGSGGGVYTTARRVQMSDSSVTGNHASGNGGGVCQNNDNAAGYLSADGMTVSDNIAGGMGGGLYTLTHMKMSGVTSVTGNRLTTGGETAENAAGVYLKDAVYLDLGTTGGNSTTNVLTVKNNLTVDGAPSDLRLPDTTGGEIVNDNRVRVFCGIGGEIRVVNAKKLLTQFGTAQGELSNPAGFTDEHKVFWSEDGSLYGIVDRQDDTGKKIIWGGDPICKITDGNGRLLYIDDQHVRPAVFDRLDALTADHTEDTTTTSAFSTLRSLDSGNQTLYYANGEPYTGSVYQVKMLVEHYSAEYYMEITGGMGRTVILTTAGSKDSLYPYGGREGTHCTITRDPGMDGTKPLITAKTNLTVNSITLDGNQANVTAGENTRLITADYGDYAAIVLTLGRNATLQNATVAGSGRDSSGNGGGVYVNWGAQLAMSGGTIRGCCATNGGGVYIDGGAGTMVMTVGTITKCSATGNGGGVYFYKGKADNADDPKTGMIRISGGSISRCTAQNGGGIYLNAGNTSGPSGSVVSRRLYMSGGSIAQNSVTGRGGGIAVGDKYARIYFSGAPYVYQNTSSSASAGAAPEGQEPYSSVYLQASNVEMDQGFTRTANNPATVIVSRGLIRGASIGVYVPDKDSLYENHGAEMDPFATFEGSATGGMNYFINDRNGMKGGQLDNASSSDKKIYWRKIYSLTVAKQVLSDDPDDLNSSKSYRFEVQLTGTISQAGQPDILAENFTGSYGGMNFTNGVAHFALHNGEERVADLLPLGFGYIVREMLTSEQQAHFKTSAENDVGTLSSERDSSGYPFIEGEMNSPTRFNYRVTFNNLHAVCKIVGRNGENDEELLYTYDEETGKYIPAVYSALVTAFNKVNAGDGIDWYLKNESGGYERFYPVFYSVEMLVPTYEMKLPAGLNGQQAELTTASRDADDGFPYVGGNSAACITRGFDGAGMLTVDSGSLTLGRITLDGDKDDHSSDADGGIVHVSSGAALTVGTGVTLQNSVTSGSGAAVYLDEGAVMNISGARVFKQHSVRALAGGGSEERQ